MTARLAVMGVVLLATLLLQTVVAPALSVAGWRPDLLVVSVVGFALADGSETGARYGFATGLCADLLSGSGQLVGLTALVLLLVGYGVGGLRPYMSGTARVGESAVGAGAGAIFFVLSASLSQLLDVRQLTVVGVLEGALATGVWTALLAPLLCRPLASLSHRYAGGDAAPATGQLTGPAARHW